MKTKFDKEFFAYIAKISLARIKDSSQYYRRKTLNVTLAKMSLWKFSTILSPKEVFLIHKTLLIFNMHPLTSIKKNILFKYQQKTRNEDFSLLLRFTKIRFLLYFVDLCASVDCNHGICEVLSESQTQCNCSTGWFGEFCDVGKFREKKMIQYFFDRDDFCFSALQISVFP